MKEAPINASALKHWSAVVPICMSAAALILLLVYLAVVGIQLRQPDADEGAAARIFQLLMTAQLPIVAYFAIKWLPRSMRHALLVLVLQGFSWVTAVGTLLFVEAH